MLANDTDIDGGPKTIISVTQPAHGTVVITNGGDDLTYKPNDNYCNDGSPLDTFTYTLNGGSVGTVSVTVTCVDDAPVLDLNGVDTGLDNGASFTEDGGGVVLAPDATVFDIDDTNVEFGHGHPDQPTRWRSRVTVYQCVELRNDLDHRLQQRHRRAEADRLRL